MQVEAGDVLTLVAADEAGNVNDEHQVTVPKDSSSGEDGNGGKDSGAATPGNGSGSGSNTSQGQSGQGYETESSKGQREGQKLPSTATSMWTIGLIGLVAVAAGIGTTMFSRRKKISE